jgi:hypothetical protein
MASMEGKNHTKCWRKILNDRDFLEYLGEDGEKKEIT